MRIAFVIDVFPRLTNTFIINQITGLLERGHEVDIYARALGDLADAPSEVERFDLTSRLRHIPVPSSRAERVTKAARLLLHPSARHQATLDALDVRRFGRDSLSLVNLYTTLSFLRQAPYDVVHCQFGKLAPPLLPLYRSGRLAGKLVTSFRGADITRLRHQHPGAYKRLFELGDLFLPVSSEFGRRLIASGCDPKRVVVHHSGVRCQDFPFAVRNRSADEATRLLFIGRLTEKKGLRYALEALAAVIANGREVEFTIIGDGEESAALKRQVEELGISRNVRFTGSQSHEQVIGHLERSHLLIAPSVTAGDGDQEGIPNVLKEAMATGIPVVATRHSGIPELVEDGVSGYLVAERDTDALADALRRLVDAPDRWPEMGRAGRRKVEAQFDSDRLNDELVELYRQGGSTSAATQSVAPAAAAPAAENGSGGISGGAAR